MNPNPAGETTLMVEYSASFSPSTDSPIQLAGSSATLEPVRYNCYENEQYETTAAVISGICLVVGVIYCFLGYRLIKAVQFLTGFLLTSVLVYLVLERVLRQHELVLPLNVGIAVAAGLVIGIVSLLIRHIGIVLTGFVGGALIGVIVSAAWRSFVISPSIWATLGLLIGNGAIVAAISVKWQRTMIILVTSFIGATALVSALDYVVDRFALLHRAWQAVGSDSEEQRTVLVQWDHLCWHSWLVLSVWPCLFAIGAIVQWNWTSVGRDHREGWTCCKSSSVEEDVVTGDTRLTASNSEICQPKPGLRHLAYVPKSAADRDTTDRKRSAAAVAAGSVAHRRCTNNNNGASGAQRSVSYESRPWRTIYQSRRAHGDVICQSYLENLQRLSQRQRASPHEYWSAAGSVGDNNISNGQSTDLTLPATDIVRSTVHCIDHGKAAT